MNHEIGSIYRKWDLHVHTPASIVHNFPGNGDDAWERWVRDIENLPPEFKVLGINDYLFIDGYRKVLDYVQKGRMSNIELFLPVVEFRLAKFAGSGNKWRKVNYHVIFSDELGPDAIQNQFLNGLAARFRLADNTAWAGLISHESLADFGRHIRETTPEDRRGSLGSDIEVGFNNLTFDQKDIEELLQSSYLKDKHLTAIGKSEWDQMRWEQSAADKKHIAQSVDFIFTASVSPEAWDTSRQNLQRDGIHTRLLDCSDAHHLYGSAEAERIGNCFTWIRADPTFAGLQMARHAFDDRVAVCSKPTIIERAESWPTKFIKSVAIWKIPGSTLKEDWFDTELPINPGLVAVIGCKGGGKSALADILGLLGGFPNHEAFSFLSKDKFRSTTPRPEKAAQFGASVTWLSATTEDCTLSDKVSPNKIVKIKYIPQKFLEDICNELQQKERGRFDDELESVIFSHVPDDQKLRTSSLRDLIDLKTSVTDEAIEQIKRKLVVVNRDICRLMTLLKPEYRLSLETQLKSKKDELEAHKRAEPKAQKKPEDDPKQKQHFANINGQLQEQRTKLKALDELIAAATKEQKSLAIEIERCNKVKGRIENFRKQYQDFLESVSSDPELQAFDVAKMVKISIDLTAVDAQQKSAVEKKVVVDKKLAADDKASLLHQRQQIESDIQRLQNSLNAPHQQYQAHLEEVEKWKSIRSTIEGDESAVGSIKFIEKALKEADQFPKQLAGLEAEQVKLTKSIYAEVTTLAESYRQLYSPVQQFIEQHDLTHKRYNLKFEVAIQESGFSDRFERLINHGVNGSFCGVEQGTERLEAILGTTDFQTEAGVVEMLSQIMQHFKTDMREGFGNNMFLDAQLKKGWSCEDALNEFFSLDYLRPRYNLSLDGKSLKQLSPGQKGTLLLVFYLLVDKSDIPLVIDQPEDNLDNQTVYDLLVPAMKFAKQCRQIVMVTHNPNLAVVCDADQVIHAAHHIDKKYRIEYKCGSLENPEINQFVLDVLEGTKPAFNTRDAKYFPSDR